MVFFATNHDIFVIFCSKIEEFSCYLSVLSTEQLRKNDASNERQFAYSTRSRTNGLLSSKNECDGKLL